MRGRPASRWRPRSGPWRYAAVYLIGQSLSLAALALVVIFVRRFDGRPTALLALMMGLASPFTTYVPIQVSHNIGLMPFWMLALLTAWSAFEQWAKYAILLLVGPLGLAFLAIPQWRRQLLTPGPWIAFCIGAIVIAPHVKDVLDKCATTIAFATKTQRAGFGHSVGVGAKFLLNCILAQAIMVVIALAAVDRRSLLQVIGASLRRAGSSRRELFVHTTACPNQSRVHRTIKFRYGSARDPNARSMKTHGLSPWPPEADTWPAGLEVAEVVLRLSCIETIHERLEVLTVIARRLKDALAPDTLTFGVARKPA
jgi:hypothetical protein